MHTFLEIDHSVRPSLTTLYIARPSRPSCGIARPDRGSAAARLWLGCGAAAARRRLSHNRWRRDNGDQQEDELDRVDRHLPCQAGVSSVESMLLATPACSCERERERERARAARCAAMHLSLRAQRPTTAQRCHGGARQTEKLCASGSGMWLRARSDCRPDVMMS